MALKVNEPYRPDVQSAPMPEGLLYELAGEDHFEAVVQLMAERNPDHSVDFHREKTTKEIQLNITDDSYFLCVATLKGKVIGLSRFFHSCGLPEPRKKFSAPEGWYAMGTVVNKSFRRNNISRFLFEQRNEKLRQLGAQCFYSVVDENNLTSLRMHQKFGYKEVAKGKGFLHLDFSPAEGILFSFEL